MVSKNAAITERWRSHFSCSQGHYRLLRRHSLAGGHLTSRRAYHLLAGLPIPRLPTKFLVAVQFPPTLIPGCPTWLELEISTSTPPNYPLDTTDLPADLPAAASTPLAGPLADCLPAGLANSAGPANSAAVPFPPTLTPGCPSWVALELDTSL